MRNAFEEGQKRGYCGSTELEIVAPKRSWRDIFCRKPQQMKNSLNFANTCLKIIDTRRSARSVFCFLPHIGTSEVIQVLGPPLLVGFPFLLLATVRSATGLLPLFEPRM